MHCHIPAVAAALTVALAAVPANALRPDPLPSLFVDFFVQWKAQPKDLRISDLRVLKAGESLRVLCGAYAVPGQARRPFLVMGDATPSASAAWEPGSFPESDPLYPQLMDNLRQCQTLGAEVTAAQWHGDAAPAA
ncbi:hypothetical protein LJR219_002153 [Phenylobacterium sp. LjRoot219]|uniref:hypothetical protein n=1 Tax=Phenylobacterium sp. LjRoot219 TaxID=3342283 RepID=UPI003ECFB649